ncbi:acyltransferase [Microvirga aerilata]|uniref:Acyltransferase n=1 Tax=Microvirga aerilata TaxID=670292 RepID=A0A936Z9D6_9HYPH|nr:acyltransferase [Microvirga aerilata]MBL0406326.1 acyltransferase [Microvirga aerilata]
MVRTDEEGARDKLRDAGIHVSGPAHLNEHTFVICEPTPGDRSLELNFSFGSRNVIFLGQGDDVAGVFQILGDDNLLIFEGKEDGPARISGQVHGSNNSLLWRRGATSNGTNVILQDGTTISVGADCMFAERITLRSTDNHALIDIESKRAVNPPADVFIGPHVWLADGVTVLKGVQIGAGSVIAGGALVNRNVPAQVLVGGIPAKVIKKGATWTRDINPTAEMIDAVLDVASSDRLKPSEADEERLARENKALKKILSETLIAQSALADILRSKG